MTHNPIYTSIGSNDIEGVTGLLLLFGKAQRYVK